MARPTLDKKKVNGKLTYYVNGTAYTDKDKARNAITKFYESGADAETKQAKEYRKLIEAQLKKDEPKKPTAKERKIEKQLKLGGSYVDPDTGFSTTDSLEAGGAYTPERFKAPKEEKNIYDKLSKISTEINKIDRMKDNKLITRKEAKAQKKELLEKADSLKAKDPVTARIDTLINSLANIKAEPKKPKLSPSKVFNNLSRADGKAVRNKMYEIQTNEPKLKKMERLERALKELGHIQ